MPDYQKILVGYILGVASMEGVTYEDCAQGLTDDEHRELKRLIIEIFHNELKAE